MNTLHTLVPNDGVPNDGVPNDGDSSRFDWNGQIKLAIVLSVIAAIMASSLAGRVAEPVFIVGVIVVASFAAWARVQPVQPLSRQPIRIPVRSR